MTSSRFSFALFFLSLSLWPLLHGDERDRLKVGVQPDGRIVVPTNQILKPAGKQITFPGRPVDLAFADEGRTLVVKNMNDLVFIDTVTAAVKQRLGIVPTRPGFSAVGLLVKNETIYATDGKDSIRVARRQEGGNYQFQPPIGLVKPKVGGVVHPTGMAFHGDDKLWVASSRGNNVQLVNLKDGKVEQVVSVGVAPYTVIVAGPKKCYVSNWGGDPPKPGEPQAESSKTPTRIDPKTGVANHGSVSVVEPADGQWRQTKTITVGLHPSGMVLSKTGKFLYVANANSDTVSAIDTAKDEVIGTIPCRPEDRLPFGSGTNALALSPDGGTLYVANGTNNCVAIVALGRGLREDDASKSEISNLKSEIQGFIPTGWYPGALLLSPGKKLWVANVKGHGSLSPRRAGQKGKNTHDHLGSVSTIDIPDAAQLARYTEEVNANNRLAYSLAGLEKPRPDIKPVPVPGRHGEPSVFKHVIYVIKENRTYDQVFGDMKEGDGDASLAIFGEEVTPNHHALARQFTLFDNFYCSGVLSADGHAWVTEAYVTDYLEKAFGDFSRSYPFDGGDPLAYASSGFLWDNALRHKKTIRNYGEFVTTETKPGKQNWTAFYDEYRNNTSNIAIKATATVHTLVPHTHPGYPSFVMTIPDVLRARIFIEELKSFEKKGEFPNLTYLFLPCDHTSGTRQGSPTPRAMVADNDLALGQIVEAVSKSKFWPETCIFVVEDDPQDGFDHVDSHRTVAFAISPYTKRKFVDHTNYNQTGMVKTIELMLGLPPMNQLDLSATAMRNCFQSTPDLTPYTHLPNRIALDEMNPPLRRLRGQALHWAKKSHEMNLDEVDKADEDIFNRVLWHSVRGYDTPYPAHFAGGGRDNED